MADALGLGPSGRKALQVQLLSSAQIKKNDLSVIFLFQWIFRPRRTSLGLAILMGCVLLDTNWVICKSN